MRVDQFTVVRAAAHTMAASRMTMFKARLFGIRYDVYMPDDNATHTITTYKGVNYFLGTTERRKTSRADEAFGMLRDLLAVFGLFAFILCLGLQAGGFFHYLATKYPGNAVLQFFFGA